MTSVEVITIESVEVIITSGTATAIDMIIIAAIGVGNTTSGTTTLDGSIGAKPNLLNSNNQFADVGNHTL